MRLGNRSNIQTTMLSTDKGCKKKYRNCYKSSSSSSCSSSSSSSSSCSSSSSSSDASYDHLDACYGKIKNLTGTNLTYTNASVSNLYLQNGLPGDIPVLVSTTSLNVSVPFAYSNFCSTYLFSSSTPTTLSFQSLLGTNLNGARLVLANVSGGDTNITATLVSPNVFNYAGIQNSTFSATLNSNTSAEFVTLFVSNNAVLYRIR